MIRKVQSDGLGNLNPEQNMERSYNLLLSETERDIKEQEETAAQEAQLGQFEGESLLSKWDRFKQKCDYTLPPTISISSH